MSLRYADYEETKYNCVNPNLTGVRAWIDVENLNNQIVSLGQQIEDAKRTVPIGRSLRDSVIHDIRQLAAKVPDILARLDILRDACRLYQDGVGLKNSRIPEGGRIGRAVRQITSVYFSFDLEKFEEDFATAYPEATSNDPTGTIKALTTELNDAKELATLQWPNDPNELCRYFRGNTIPEEWQGNRVSAEFTAVSMASLIYSSFVADWRLRAPTYGEPVTINGVSIKSLPEKKKTAWLEAYGFLKLGQLAKHVRFTAKQSSEVAETTPELRDDESFLPPAFRTRGRPKKKD